MKLRVLISMVLVTALALPVIATTRFPDVPTDHQHADAIRWASDPEEFNGNPLFRGFVDGSFGPDVELTEGQFTKVVDRLFDSVDRWTRAETAALLYHGFNGLRSTTTTTTTHPVVIEGEQPGGVGPGEEETTTTTSPEETTTTTTTQPTTTTTTIPPFPIVERLRTLEGKIQNANLRFQDATAYPHLKKYATLAKETADEAVEYATQLMEEYNNYEGAIDIYTKRLRNTHDLAVRWQEGTGKVVEWQITEQPADTLDKQATSQYNHQAIEKELLPEDVVELLNNLSGIQIGDYTDDIKRGIYRYLFYHTLRLIEKLDTERQIQATKTDRDLVSGIHFSFINSLSYHLRWLLRDAGFKEIGSSFYVDQQCCYSKWSVP